MSKKSLFSAMFFLGATDKILTYFIVLKSELSIEVNPVIRVFMDKLGVVNGLVFSFFVGYAIIFFVFYPLWQYAYARIGFYVLFCLVIIVNIANLLNYYFLFV